MLVDEFVKHLEERSGIEPLKFSNEGVISFMFNDEYTTNIEKSPDDQFITVYANIGELPVEKREGILLSLLEANLFSRDTGGGSFGLDKGTRDIYLFKTFALSALQFDLFYDELIHILQMQQEWTAKIKDKNFLSQK